MKTKLKARAKINLFLHVTQKIAGGWHILDSLVAFADDVYDVIQVDTSSSNSVHIDGGEFRDAVSQYDNIISDVYEKFSNGRSFRYSLTKNIPVGAGLGGGSSDAAAVARFLNPDIYIPDLASIGADVPVCYNNKASFFGGIGELVSTASGFPQLHAILINPRKQLLTKDVFLLNKNIGRNSFNRRDDFKYDIKDLIGVLASLHNDLEDAAISLMPEIKLILSNIKQQSGCLISRMSGSGSTCFGIFSTRDEAIAARDNMLALNSDLWVKYTTLS